MILLAALSAKKKRKKPFSPTARALKECRSRGWIAQVVEQTIPHVFIKRDLFGCIDIVAIVPSEIRRPNCMTCVYKRPYGGEPFECPNCKTTNDVLPSHIIGIQATGGQGGAHAARVRKIKAEPRARQWIEAGCRLEVWSYALRGAAGSRKTYELRVEEIRAQDIACVSAHPTQSGEASNV